MKQWRDTKMTVGCVAEGPGGFIHALIDYREKQQADKDAPIKDNYSAITLKIDSNTRHAKDWSDWRGAELFKRLRSFGYKIKLSYGKT